jgi:hypothetical protein
LCEGGRTAGEVEVVSLSEVLGEHGAKDVVVDVRSVASDRLANVDLQGVVVAGFELGVGERTYGERRSEPEIGGVSTRRLGSSGDEA